MCQIFKYFMVSFVNMLTLNSLLYGVVAGNFVLELSDSCDILIITIVVDYRDNDSIQSYNRDTLDLSKNMSNRSKYCSI